MKRFLATTALLMLPIAAMADGMDEDRIKELVLEAIRENPGIVFEAAQLFEQQQQALQAQTAAQILDTEKATLENDPNAPVLGNPDGDVTVVEFFDYNCPYCRRVKPEMEALLAADPNVRVVYREWPILGDGSVFAARAALASRNQGKYEEFHWAMMQLKERAEEASILRTAEDIGLDVAQLRRDMNGPEIEEHIQTSMRLAQSLGFSGTPSFVIGDSLAPGLIQADQMIELVDQARAAE
ncbi:DsbA family protein [Sulfitobacter sp. KE29]|jgi:protein-disulfide isomerase|uniref:Protein-disulfide isomerase n=1 Tax=Sulfitobacter delicatus TaxID=218672 RepID=A0A1G7WWD1_9RHOB|nr:MULTISPECIES: DsbA family protein [Sulfitobacter]MDF3419541.1 DsbA family protein [Sulfitobacter sp. Ks38]MDF3427023.1 DsbA family protein [Sulfitobacter sp. KE29]MDF3430605.1 DsbA family protein [Sulfitobacter sp. S46]MDF3445377.1 DsbA family protein [Sulfitobacter sp. KE31]MDF3549402.1 DsbA family protein [Sulfitobacter sp. KE28]